MSHINMFKSNTELELRQVDASKPNIRRTEAEMHKVTLILSKYNTKMAVVTKHDWYLANFLERVIKRENDQNL